MTEVCCDLHDLVTRCGLEDFCCLECSALAEPRLTRCPSELPGAKCDPCVCGKLRKRR